MMRALVLLALAAAAPDVTVGTVDEPTPVKTATKLRAALAKGDPVVELWDDILLDGAPAVALHDVIVEGGGHVLYQTGGARHVVANAGYREIVEEVLRGCPSTDRVKQVDATTSYAHIVAGASRRGRSV